MQPGDNIYFFFERKIYGIGELITIVDDCKHLNYPHADEPKILDFDKTKPKMLINNESLNLNNRCICTFKPSPNFFIQGIDMDDVLASNPRSFRMLRAFWKLSFIKIDDTENKALRDIILKRNEDFINNKEGVFSFNNTFHKSIKLKVNDDYKLTSKNILNNCNDKNKIKHEMAIEASIIDLLTCKDNTPFGKWDYLSHQVIASPFKPIDYMDKMDVFGYRFISDFDTISKYLVIEIKKDKATKEAIDQIMKYVDWINQEYAFGDYSMIRAFLVCYSYPDNVIEYAKSICTRNYTKGRRPIVAATWTDIKLIKYSFDNQLNELVFTEIK